MAIKSQTKYSERSKHQVANRSVIFENDLTTMDTLLSPISSSVPVYTGGEMVVSKTTEQNFKRNYKKAEWLANGVDGDEWTGDVVKSVGIPDSDSNSETQNLKKDYNKLQEFAYYGSCTELMRTSLNNIISKFPGEIYADMSVNGDGQIEKRTIIDDNGVPYGGIGPEGLYHDAYCLNPFGVDIFTEIVNGPSTIGSFANGGFRNYEVITKSGYTWKVGFWKVDNRTDKKCLLPGDIVCSVTIGRDENLLGISTMSINVDFEIGLERTEAEFMTFLVIKLKNGYGLFTTDKYLGWHVRPSREYLDMFYSGLTAFERQLINRYSTPRYKTTFEVIIDGDNGLEKELRSFIFPTDEGGYNLDVMSSRYMRYAGQLASLGDIYDEYYSDNLYRNMAHTSVKNMDWSKTDGDDDTNEYTEGADKLKKVFRVVGRCFDEIKGYIDGVENVHVVSYNDKTGTSNYNLSDELELDGWDVVSVAPLKQKGYYEHDGEEVLQVEEIPFGDSSYVDTIVELVGSDWNKFTQFGYYRCTKETDVCQVASVGPVYMDVDSEDGIFETKNTCLKGFKDRWVRFTPLTIAYDETKNMWLMTGNDGSIVRQYKTLDSFGFGISSRGIVDDKGDYRFVVTNCVWRKDKPIEAGTKIYTDTEPYDKCTNTIKDDTDTLRVFYRDFYEDTDGVYTPYSGDTDGVFIKCCGEEEPASGRTTMAEVVYFVTYKGIKYYLNCDGYLLERTDDGIVRHPIDNGFIHLRGEMLPVESEYRLLNRVKPYTSNEEYDINDINYEFQKRLKLCSKSILRKKGTAAAIEELLGLFGLKSERFVNLSGNDDIVSDYTIKEAVMFTRGIKDNYDAEHKMPRIDWYNSTKAFRYHTANSRIGIYDAYRGLPVKGISYYSVYDQMSETWGYNHTGFDWLGNKLREDFRMLYPYFDDTIPHDGDMYYQMYGGWLKKLPYTFGKKNLILCGERYTETLRNVMSVDAVADLVDIPYEKLHDNFVCEVLAPNDKPYMNINGELFEVKTESIKIVNNENIDSHRQTVSYIEVNTYDNGFVIGDSTYYGIVAVSDPCRYGFERRIDLSRQIGRKTEKVYLYALCGEEKVPVNVYNLQETCSGITADNVTVDIATVLSSDTGEMYMTPAEAELVMSNEGYSNYWVLDTPDNHRSYAMQYGPYGIGWKHLADNDPLVKQLDGIETVKRGNNPHSALIPYDDGAEYLDRYVHLFKIPYVNSDFDERCYYDPDAAFDEILSYGFENIFVDKYSTYINPTPITKATLERMELISSFDDGKLVLYWGDDTDEYQHGHYYRGTASIDPETEEVQYIWVEEEQDKIYINGLYDTKVHSFCDKLLYDGSVYKYGSFGNTLFDVSHDGVTNYPRLGDDDNDSEPDRIVNAKYVDIKFYTNSDNVELVKYYDAVLVSYLQQLLPSTIIASISYGVDGSCGIGCMVVEDNFIVR